MRDPYLVLRLNAMTVDGPMPAGLPARFSSGEKLDPLDCEYINSVLRADYMGSAEFEFGATGRAFRTVAANTESFANFSFEVTGKPKVLVPDFPEDALESRVTLHGFCQAEDVMKVEEAIRKLIAEPGFYRTKESLRIAESLFGEYRNVHYGPSGRRRRKPLPEHQLAEHTAWFDLDAFWFVSKSAEQAALARQILGLPAV